MKVFRYSKQEYRADYKRLLLSPQISYKTVSLARTGQDDKICNLKLFGYPMRPSSINKDQDKLFGQLCEQLKNDKTELIAV